MRADMGSANSVIAPQLPALLEGRRRELDTSLAEKRMERARRFVKVERELRDRIAKLHERLTTTRSEQHLTPERIERVVRVALALTDKPDLTPTTLQDAPGARVFRMPALAGSWSRCLDGLEHPYTKRTRPITFDHEVAKGRDDVVLVHLNHPLVQMSLRLLRAEVWARDDVKKLHRVTVRTLPDAKLDGPAVVVVSRLVITGGNHHRLHEELTEAGGYLRDAGFRREDGVTKLREWIDSSMPGAIQEPLFDALRARFQKHSESIMSTVGKRSKDRLDTLGGTLESRKRREIADMTELLDDLAKNLETELKKDDQPQQLLLFSEDERTQVRRDRFALEAGRLRRIPEEREHERRAIEERHFGLVDLTFPVAVILLVPGPARYAAPSCTEGGVSAQHEWLNLLEVSGPFVAVPVLREVFRRDSKSCRLRAPRGCAARTRSGATLSTPKTPIWNGCMQLGRRGATHRARRRRPVAEVRWSHPGVGDCSVARARHDDRA